LRISDRTAQHLNKYYANEPRKAPTTLKTQNECYELRENQEARRDNSNQDVSPNNRRSLLNLDVYVAEANSPRLDFAITEDIEKGIEKAQD
jgi:hypothetical protein